jgi:tetratricopeptide (TPR) repeat protein
MSAASPFRMALRCLLPAGLLLLAGCAAPVQTTGYTASPIENQLMAEIALQRGEYLVSVQQYLALSQQSRQPEYARRATELAYEYGLDAYALAGAQRWVELAPDSVVAHGYLGRLYVLQNQLDKAWDALEFSLGPAAERTDDDYTELSGDLSISGEPARALKIYQRFNAVYPEVPGITGSIAGLAAEIGDMELAITAARETMQLSPDWVGSRIWLARFLLASGDRYSAFEQMAFALEMSPGLELELEFVRLLARAAEFQDALDRLARLDERYPGDPELIRTRAQVLMQSGDLDAAQVELITLLSDAWCVNECFWYLGEIAMQQGNYMNAVRYSSRVSSGPWLESARLNMTQAYLALGDADTALQVQSDFAASYPKYTFTTFRTRAEIMVGLGRYTEALELMTEALEYKPWKTDLWLYKGGILDGIDKDAEAIKAFRKAVALEPDNATALNALGYTLAVTTRDYDEAYDYISQANELAPDSPAIMDSMGWVLFKQGENAAARQWLERAYGLLPDPEIAAHLGEVLWAIDERDAAIELWGDALADNPENSVLKATIERFLN